MKKRFMKTLFLTLSLALLSIPLVNATETVKTKTTSDIPDALTKVGKENALKSFQEQMEEKQKNRKFVLNKIFTDKYEYEHPDGSISKIVVETVNVKKENKNMVKLIDGKIKLDRSLSQSQVNTNNNEPVTSFSTASFTDYVQEEGYETYVYTYYGQKLYGAFTYEPGVNGSMEKAYHYQPPQADAGIHVSAGDPKPGELILDGENAAHVYSNCRFDINLEGEDIVEKDQRVIIVYDINGNYNVVIE
ncbi:MAG: hypothetical protein H0Z33_10235 [Bacillaceae bacterium]|nr:hypothetical protein [Bacillaceae bacterium]